MPLAPIERLPVELLQPIFLLSDYNLSLPLASPNLAAKLSDDYIYNAVCTQYLTTNLENRAWQTTAQSRIFASRWMTWDYFKSWVLRKWGDKQCLCGKTPDEGCFDQQWPPNFEDATRMLFSRSHLPQLSYIKCRIPAKLLHGPWTTDKIQFLRFLLWTVSVTVDWANPDIRRLAIEGKMEAIREKNLEAVELFNHNRRLGKAPNMDTVRFGVFEGGCDRSVMYDIMSTARTWGMRGAQWKCEKLDAWCDEQIKNGNPKGKWLQLKLMELRAEYGSTGRKPAENEEPGVQCGWMHPKTGDYDDVEGDKLVINVHRWSQVRFLEFRTARTYDW
ncbi:hypothetical protein P154DRAFT_315542 [Amniculicola lignicola CBS 123094]|uniref:Uncharacterized protein n=1 Tax=Amniculicola lignicola CBS 123094 TaxID=1392246 RepID=A0A6A5WWY7_9PLEO|nr:hypothetical protein P154DRAFT_315542 [Amniculicola lignicola CBS 123094]